LTERWCKTSRSAGVLQAERSAGGLHKSLMFTASLPVHRFRRLQHALKKEKGEKKYVLIFCPKILAKTRPILGIQNLPYGEMVCNVNLIKCGRLLPAKNMKFDTRCWEFSVYLITFFHCDLGTNFCKHP
jgi:hypothetical protein